MKARLENGELLVDFNSEDLNPQYVINMTKEQYKRFKEICNIKYRGFEDMELEHLVDVLIKMAIYGDFK